MSLSKNVNPNVTKHERKHDPEQIQLAIDAVKRGMSYRGAAQMYQLPKSTVQDAVRWGVMKRKGPEPYLSADVEQQIVSWVSRMADIRYGQTKSDILDKVQVLVNSLNLETPWPTGWPLDKWYQLFMGCNPLLQYCMVSALSKERGGVMYDHLYAWFL